MPIMTFTNTAGSDIAVGNADGYGKSFTIPVAGCAVHLTGMQLESSGPQLDSLKSRGFLSWVKTQDPAVSDDLEILSGSPSRMAMVSIGPVAAKSTTAVHAAFVGSVGRAKLLLDTGSGNATVTAVNAGVSGNLIDIVLTGDAGAGVRITHTSPAGRELFTILYQTGVSTQGTLNTAINALTGADKLIEVTTSNAGTTATVLTAVADDFALTPLAGGTALGGIFPGAFTNPDVPRNGTVTYAANWDAGAVTLRGTNYANAAVTDVIAGTAGATVVGVVAFKTITGATTASVGKHTSSSATIGTGDTIGIPFNVVDTVGFCYVGVTVQAGGVTLNATYDTFVPGTTLPNATTYTVLCNVNP